MITEANQALLFFLRWSFGLTAFERQIQPSKIVGIAASDFVDDLPSIIKMELPEIKKAVNYSICIIHSVGAAKKIFSPEDEILLENAMVEVSRCEDIDALSELTRKISKKIGIKYWPDLQRPIKPLR
jgi:hypothetical protein